MGTYSREDILRLIKSEDVQFIRMQFTDLFGQIKNVAVTASQAERALDGDIMLDVNGDPMIQPKVTWGYDDWECEVYAATPEQVQAVRELIDSSVAATNNDETILNIIQEEAQGYFEGQKSAQDVANVIQSRVQTYVSENS